MRKLIIVAIALGLVACSNKSPCCGDTVPTSTVTVTVPSAQPTAEPTVAPKQKPKPKLKWLPFSPESEARISKTGECAMLFFNQRVAPCPHCDKMEETLQDPEVVRLVSEAFVPLRFPVEVCISVPDCEKMLREQLEITKLPTTVLAYHGDDSRSLYAEGYMGAADFKKFLLTEKEKYNKCKNIKEELNE